MAQVTGFLKPATLSTIAPVRLRGARKEKPWARLWIKVSVMMQSLCLGTWHGKACKNPNKKLKLFDVSDAVARYDSER